MREAGSNGSGLLTSSCFSIRALRLAAILLGVGLVLSAGPVRAQDDDDSDTAEDSRSFERKLIDNLMSGLGGKRLEDGTINYRERSPLVIPSKIDLPPPETGKPKLAPNWPKDPDEADRKAARAAANAKLPPTEVTQRPLMPSELEIGKLPRGSNKSDDTSPGHGGGNPALMPSELGYVGGLFSNPFGGAKPETKTFTAEPERTELTQPPSGYQTPSPNYSYGIGDGKQRAPKEVCDSSTGKCERSWD